MSSSSRSQAFTQNLLSLSHFNFLVRLLKPAEISFSSSSTEDDSFRNSSININVGGLTNSHLAIKLVMPAWKRKQYYSICTHSSCFKEACEYYLLSSYSNASQYLVSYWMSRANQEHWLLINQIPPIGFVATF